MVVRTGSGGPEVLLVHRPEYDDWTFPKGKLERGETEEECALREVEEETGLRCTLGRELESTTYRDAKRRRKRVRYWLMEVASGESRLRQRDRRRAVATTRGGRAAELRARHRAARRGACRLRLEVRLQPHLDSGAHAGEAEASPVSHPVCWRRHVQSADPGRRRGRGPRDHVHQVPPRRVGSYEPHVAAPTSPV